MDKLAIYIQEEYGYRDWLWVPNMNLEEVKDWWKKLPSVEPYFFDGPISFPGEVHQIAFYSDKEFRFVVNGMNRVVYPMHDDILTLPDDCVRMHIHEDFDSWLTVGEEVLHHAGYLSFREAIDKE
mgnify:FL=1